MLSNEALQHLFPKTRRKSSELRTPKSSKYGLVYGIDSSLSIAILVAPAADNDDLLQSSSTHPARHKYNMAANDEHIFSNSLIIIFSKCGYLAYCAVKEVISPSQNHADTSGSARADTRSAAAPRLDLRRHRHARFDRPEALFRLDPRLPHRHARHIDRLLPLAISAILGCSSLQATIRSAPP